MKKKENEDKPEAIPNQWLNLPTDLSMNKFCEDFFRQVKPRTKPAAGTVREALISLEEDNQDPSKSISDSIFAKRERDEKGRSTTTPRAVFWEVQELIRIILHTYQMDKSLRGEHHASRVLQELANSLRQNGFEDIQEDFVRLKVLSCAGVQEKLISLLEQELQGRWEMLKRLVVSNKLLETMSNLKLALEQIDETIAEICNRKSVENDVSYKIEDSQYPQTAEVLKLYSELVSEREKLLPQERKSLPSDEYRWVVSDESKKLVDAMQETLRKYRRGKKENSFDEFLEIYNHYLCLQTSEEVKKRANSFASDYARILEYINGNSDKNQFENAVLEELSRFAKDIFDDLERLDAYGYSYCRFDPPKAIDAHFRTRLADIHRDIQMSIHEPVMCLRIAYTVFHFLLYPGVEQGNCCSLTPKGKADMEKLVGRMRQLVHEMQRDVEGIATLTESETIQYSKFYNAKVVPMMECSKIAGESLKELITYMNSDNQDDYLNKWKATTKLLTYQCRMVVALKVAKSVDDLTKEYMYFCNMVRDNSVHF